MFLHLGSGADQLEELLARIHRDRHEPEALPEILHALRETITGTFSIKVRAGYSDPEQIFSLLPLFESGRGGLPALHARTVEQRYEGAADHSITARVVRQTRLPVIANGDICTAAGGAAVLRETGAAGLMLGRERWRHCSLRAAARAGPGHPDRGGTGADAPALPPRARRTIRRAFFPPATRRCCPS